MDTLGLVSTLVALVIFGLALYEAVDISRIIGRIPRFWYFFLAAILFVIVRRVLILISTGLVVSLPSYWSTIDNDGTPIIFSALLFLWVYDMKRSFQKAAPKRAQEQLLPPEKV